LENKQKVLKDAKSIEETLNVNPAQLPRGKRSKVKVRNYYYYYYLFLKIINFFFSKIENQRKIW
jgi:hypothetical protein